MSSIYIHTSVQLVARVCASNEVGGEKLGREADISEGYRREGGRAMEQHRTEGTRVVPQAYILYILQSDYGNYSLD